MKINAVCVDSSYFCLFQSFIKISTYCDLRADFVSVNLSEVWIPPAMQDNVSGARELFPPAICAVALDVIRLLDDSSMDTSKVSGMVVITCLLELYGLHLIYFKEGAIILLFFT